MIKHLCVFTLLLSMLGAASQTTTTNYYTAFDNAAQRNGWAQYRSGDPSAYEFGYVPSAYSTPTCVYHDYPVGGSQVTIDWFVSPVFDFSAGGKIDSIRVQFGGFG